MVSPRSWCSGCAARWTNRSARKPWKPSGKARTREPAPCETLLTRYWRPLLLCFLITLGGTVAFYTYSVNAPAIVKATYKSEAMTATWINLAGLIFLMLLQPVGGIISDKVGRKPLLVWFGVGGLFYTYVLITYLPETRSPIMSFLMVAVGYVILTGYTSINALVKSELFPAHIRALGVGVGLRAGELDIRRHRAADLPGDEGARPGAVVHRVRDRLHRGVAGRLHLLHQEQVRDVPRPRAGSGIPLTKAIAVGAVVLALATACSRGDTVQAPQTSVAPAPTPAAAPASTVPPTAAPAPDFATVSKLMNDAIAAQKLPGAVVVIGHGGKVVFHQAYGSRKLAGEPGLDGSPAPAEPMTEDTIFDMASLTKSLATATAVMQLYEQGKVAVRRSRAEVSARLQHGERSAACKGDGSHVADAHVRRTGRRRPQRSVGTGRSR